MISFRILQVERQIFHSCNVFCNIGQSELNQLFTFYSDFILNIYQFTPFPFLILTSRLSIGKFFCQEFKIFYLNIYCILQKHWGWAMQDILDCGTMISWGAGTRPGRCCVGIVKRNLITRRWMDGALGWPQLFQIEHQAESHQYLTSTILECFVSVFYLRYISGIHWIMEMEWINWFHFLQA